MKLYKNYSLLTVLLLSPLFSFCQERITEHIGEGTNTAFHNTEYEDILYLIRITQCDEIEVNVVEGLGEYTSIHSVTIPDAFGQGNYDVVFTNEYMCFPSKEGLVAYNFIENTFTTTPLPDPWSYSLFWTVIDYKLQVSVKLPDQSEFKVGIFDIKQKDFTFLDDSRYFLSSRGKHIVELEFTNGSYSYYLYDDISGLRDTILKNISRRIAIEWEDDTNLVYLNADGVLENFNVEEESFTQHSSITTDITKSYRLYVREEYLIVGYRGDAKVYDLKTKELIAEKSFEQIDNHFNVVSYDMHGEVVIAFLDTGIYMWNIETDQVEYFQSAHFDKYKIHSLSENKSLIRINGQTDLFTLGIVDHDDLSVEHIDIELYDIIIYQSTLFEKDGYSFLNLNYRYDGGINTMIEIDILNRSATVTNFDETVSGFPYRSNLIKLNNAKVVYTYGFDYPQRLFDLDNQGKEPVDSTDIFWQIVQDGKIYYYSREDRVLLSYDGIREELLVQDNYPITSSPYLYLRSFSDYENVLLLDEKKLYAFDKSNNTHTIIEDNTIENDLIKYDTWTYYTTDDGLFRVDSLLAPNLVSQLEINMENYFVFEDELHVTHGSTLFKITDAGQLEVVADTGFNFRDGHLVVSPNSNHLLLSTSAGTVHYNGDNFNELVDTFYNTYKLNENIIYNQRDLMYLLDEQEILPFPDVLRDGRLNYFKAYGDEFIVKATGFSPYNEATLYRVNEDLTSIEFLSSHRGSANASGEFNFIEFENTSLLLMSGMVYTFSKDAELNRIPGLINTNSQVIKEDEDVYFLGYNKNLGNQVYRWNQDFGSATAEIVSEKQQITIFPNPNIGAFNILNNSNLKILNIDIIDIAGNVLPQRATENEIILQNYSPGLYFVNIVFDDMSMWTGKVVIER